MMASPQQKEANSVCVGGAHRNASHGTMPKVAGSREEIMSFLRLMGEWQVMYAMKRVGRTPIYAVAVRGYGRQCSHSWTGLKNKADNNPMATHGLSMKVMPVV